MSCSARLAQARNTMPTAESWVRALATTAVFLILIAGSTSALAGKYGGHHGYQGYQPYRYYKGYPKHYRYYSGYGSHHKRYYPYYYSHSSPDGYKYKGRSYRRYKNPSYRFSIPRNFEVEGK